MLSLYVRLLYMNVCFDCCFKYAILHSSPNKQSDAFRVPKLEANRFHSPHDVKGLRMLGGIIPTSIACLSRQRSLVFMVYFMHAFTLKCNAR